MRPGGSGAAETFEPRQIREEAAVRGSLWAPPGCLPGYAEIIKGPSSKGQPFLVLRGRLLEELKFGRKIEGLCVVEMDSYFNITREIYVLSD
jgi:hypothetical protein